LCHVSSTARVLRYAVDAEQHDRDSLALCRAHGAALINGTLALFSDSFDELGREIVARGTRIHRQPGVHVGRWTSPLAGANEPAEAL
jgi:hypothetical protein